MNVSMTAADSIGRTLALLGRVARRAPAQEAESSRGRLLALLQDQAKPVSLEELSELSGLHVNTIRTHVEMLRAAGQVDRVRAEAAGRGRPKWLYSAVVEDGPLRRLSAELLAELSSVSSATETSEIARRWRHADQVSATEAANPDEAIGVAAEALEQLGFDVEVSALGDAVYLGSCPYAHLVDEQPIICQIHAVAVQQVLVGTGQDVTVASVDVFPRPGVCVARLQRPDLAPQRIITGDQLPTPSTARKPMKKTRGGTP